MRVSQKGLDGATRKREKTASGNGTEERKSGPTKLPGPRKASSKRTARKRVLQQSKPACDERGCKRSWRWPETKELSRWADFEWGEDERVRNPIRVTPLRQFLTSRGCGRAKQRCRSRCCGIVHGITEGRRQRWRSDPKKCDKLGKEVSRGDAVAWHVSVDALHADRSDMSS